jgi:DNA-directed RNA polymerase specialized sigma24 family protein
MRHTADDVSKISKFKNPDNDRCTESFIFCTMRDTMAAYTELSDTMLVDRIIGGDVDAAGYLLLNRCGPGLKYLVGTKYRTLGLDLNELVSELYLLLRSRDWQALRAFRGSNEAGMPCSLSRYIQCIAARMLYRKMEKAVKESTQTVPLDWVEGDLVDERGGVETSLAASDVIAAVLSLPDPVDRTVLIMYKLEGKEVGEVAKLLGTSPSNVYTRCSRALSLLRQTLTEGERV